VRQQVSLAAFMPKVVEESRLGLRRREFDAADLHADCTRDSNELGALIPIWVCVVDNARALSA
jgi:hypothetical protein